MADNNEKILITGSTGSLGKQLIYESASRGMRPIAHHRESSDTTYIDSLGLEKRKADLRASSELDSIMVGVDKVIHTAAWVNFRRDKLTQFTGINTFGAVNLYKAAAKAGVKRFVHVSTIAAVGARRREKKLSNGSKPPLVTEEIEFNLGNLHIPYFLSKRAAETELLKLADEGGPELIIVNPSIIVAPSRGGDDRGKALKIFSRPFLPEYSNWVNLVDIRDLAPAIINALSMGRHRERYILSGDNIMARDLVLTASATLGKVPHLVKPPRPLVSVTARLSLWLATVLNRGKVRFYPDLVRLIDYDWIFSSRKAREELGFKSRSIHMTIDDLLSNNFVGTYLKGD